MAENANFEEIISKIHKKCSDATGKHGCLLWEGATWSPGPYGKIRNPFKQYSGQPAFLRVHRLLYMAELKIMKLPKYDETGMQVELSHLCHNPKCAKLQHLTIESHEKNMERNHCKRQGLCTKNHSPSCLL